MAPESATANCRQLLGTCEPEMETSACMAHRTVPFSRLGRPLGGQVWDFIGLVESVFRHHTETCWVLALCTAGAKSTGDFLAGQLALPHKVAAD